VSNIPSAAEPRPAGEWLSPTEALGRFEPPQGAGLVVAEEAVERVRYGFKVGSLSLLVGPQAGSEVGPLAPIAGIPNSPSWLLGMINLRGNLVPVFDLARACGLDASRASAEPGGEESAAKPMILVFDKGEKAAGVLIDGFPRALTGLRRAGQLTGLPEPLARHVPAALAAADEVWFEFDHESFFGALLDSGAG